MPRLARLSAEDRAFFVPLGEAIFMSPFSAERAALIEQASPGHSGEALSLDPRAYRLTAELEQRIVRLERRGWTAIQHFELADRDLVGLIFLYQVYHRYVAALDGIIQAQRLTADVAVTVPFAEELLAQITRRGFSESQGHHYFAMFYQLRRAFYFIVQTLVGDSASMKQLRHALWNSVFTHDARNYDRYLWNRMEDFSTLLLGETGTGKGSAAAAIGCSGFIPFDSRAKRFTVNFAKLFTSINLSQFAESIIESELFGHRKGSFTGAVADHAGVFERCSSHGLLFLDEIGEVSGPIQIKLLQVLQERTFSPLGSRDTKRFAGRIVAATNRPLRDLRGRGDFRDDFFYRLSSDVIAVPSLRQRLDESPAELEQLVTSIVTRTIGDAGSRLADLVLENLRSHLPKGYPWPGNVRELEQAIRRILLTGHYSGDPSSRRGDGVELFLEDVRAGTLDAHQLQSRYCKMLYRRAGTFEEVARRTGLDRRTVKKYVAAGGD
jgi:sigma-54 specific flagellar transcriptional regulator A